MKQVNVAQPLAMVWGSRNWMKVAYIKHVLNWLDVLRTWCGVVMEAMLCSRVKSNNAVTADGAAAVFQSGRVI